MFFINSLKTAGLRILGKDHQKGAVLALLILACVGLTYYSHWVIHTDVVFSHFFYFPVVLAGFWWAKRGAWVAVSLGVLLIASHLLSGLNVPVMEDALRSVMLVAVGLTIGFTRKETLRAEKNLRETRDYLDSLIRYANAPIIVWDKEGKITLFNAAFEQLTGYRADEVMARPVEILFSEATKDKSLQKIEQTLKGERWKTVEIPIRCKNREKRILLWNSANIYSPDGKTLMAAIAQGQDITLRKQTRDALDQRMRELEAHRRTMNAMLRTLDLDERLEIGLREIMNLTGAEKAGISLVEADRLVMRKQLGFSEDYLAWAGDLAVEDYPSCEELTIGWNDIPDPSSRLETAFKKESVKSWVTVPLKSEKSLLGTLILASDRHQAFPGKRIDILSGLASSFTLMLEQATLYRTAQERLARLATLREIDKAISANLAMDGIISVVLQKVSPHIWVDAVGISLIDWKRKQTVLAQLHLPDNVNIEGEAFGMSDSLLDQLGVEKRPVIIYDVKSDPRLQNHRDIVRKYNLSTYVGIPLVVQDIAIGVLHFFTAQPYRFSQEDLDFFATLAGQASISVQNARLYEDIRRACEELQKTQEQLIQVQKMEAIGTLAGGIAHDFNNILTAVMGFGELALADLPAGSKAREYLIEVLKAGKRAKDLVGQILAFSRHTERKQRPIRLNPIVKEVLKLLHAAMPTTIEIRQNIEPDMDAVNADPTEMHQILMNLCTNAEHAMPEGGVLEVSLADVELDEEFCAMHEGLTAGSHVRLTVMDTGCGMDKQTLKRIFDPFFTTKDLGKGTGMGLSVVHGIVKGCGGDITVYSEPGTGTTFHVYLPAIRPIAGAPLETPEPVQGGTESILFVDDEAVMVDVGRETLKRLGYRVITRISSVEALELFRAKPGEFDLVITDQTMPHMTGAELAVELLRIRPDIPIILCTGFSHVITSEKASTLGIREFVMKPIVGAELGRMVRRVLDAGNLKLETGVND